MRSYTHCSTIPGQTSDICQTHTWEIPALSAKANAGVTKRPRERKQSPVLEEESLTDGVDLRGPEVARRHGGPNKREGDGGTHFELGRRVAGAGSANGCASSFRAAYVTAVDYGGAEARPSISSMERGALQAAAESGRPG